VKNFPRDLPRVWTLDRPCNPLPEDRYLLKPEVLALFAKSYPTLHELMSCNQFPRPYVIGEQNHWLLSELHEFARSLPRRRYKNDPPAPAPTAENDPPLRTTKRATLRRARSNERTSMTQEQT
jgi:predicted DNA-binding transcriptional regulator AlpA